MSTERAPSEEKRAYRNDLDGEERDDGVEPLHCVFFLSFEKDQKPVTSVRGTVEPRSSESSRRCRSVPLYTNVERNIRYSSQSEDGTGLNVGDILLRVRIGSVEREKDLQIICGWGKTRGKRRW